MDKFRCGIGQDPRFMPGVLFYHPANRAIYLVRALFPDFWENVLVEHSDDICKVTIKGYPLFASIECTLLLEATCTNLYY